MICSSADVAMGRRQTVKDNGLGEDVLDICKEGVGVDEGFRIWIAADVGYVGVAYTAVGSRIGQNHVSRDVVGLLDAVLGSFHINLAAGTTHLESNIILVQNVSIERHELSRSDHSGARDSEYELVRIILIRKRVVRRSQRLGGYGRHEQQYEGQRGSHGEEKRGCRHHENIRGYRIPSLGGGGGEVRREVRVHGSDDGVGLDVAWNLSKTPHECAPISKRHTVCGGLHMAWRRYCRAVLFPSDWDLEEHPQPGPICTCIINQ